MREHIRFVVLVVVAVAVTASVGGLGGCAAGVVVAGGEPEATPAGDDWTQSPEGKALIARADEVLAQVERVRGLRTTRPVHKGLMRRDQLKDVLLEKLREEYTDEEIQNEGLALKALGLIPADMDYKGFMVSLLVEQIAGFYDDTSQSLYIMEGQDPSTLDQVFSHELYHAVQDQQFGISKVRDEEAKANADLMLARTALIEGDAVGVMLDYDLQAQGQSFSDIPGFGMMIRLSVTMMVGGGGESFAKAPLAIREALLFPYIAGVVFVYEVKRAGGWEAVNKTYGALPASSEQILHPDRYFSGDKPKAVTFEGAAGEVIYDDVMGEQGWRVYFQQHADSDAEALVAGVAAAEGWGGDRFQVTTDDAGLSVFAFSAWDTEEDARQFAEQAVRAATARWGGTPGAAPAAGVVTLSGQGRRVWVERRGDRVLYIDTPLGDDAVTQSAQRMWDSAQVR